MKNRRFTFKEHSQTRVPVLAELTLAEWQFLWEMVMNVNATRLAERCDDTIYATNDNGVPGYDRMRLRLTELLQRVNAARQRCERELRPHRAYAEGIDGHTGHPTFNSNLTKL